MDAERRARMLAEDRADLAALLQLRFGGVPDDVQEAALRIDDPDRLERLILIAANCGDLGELRAELCAGAGEFRIVSDRFQKRPAEPSAEGAR